MPHTLDELMLGSITVIMSERIDIPCFNWAMGAVGAGVARHRAGAHGRRKTGIRKPTRSITKTDRSTTTADRSTTTTKISAASTRRYNSKAAKIF